MNFLGLFLGMYVFNIFYRFHDLFFFIRKFFWCIFCTQSMSVCGKNIVLSNDQ